MKIVFVYGTLKKGECQSYVMEYSLFLGEAKTEPVYTLFHNNSYPTLIEGGNTAVKGEMYLVSDDTLRELDIIEGVEYGLYKRDTVKIAGCKDVIAYFYLGKTESLIPAGDCRNMIVN